NLLVIWGLLLCGGYRLAETINTVLCLVLAVCLMACAATVLPNVTGELLRGLVPRRPAGSDEWLMLVALVGIVMSGSATICYTAWVEERSMGLFGYARQQKRRLTRRDLPPRSDEETRRMLGWLRVNRINIALSYGLGALICCSTFILGVAVLGPAGVTLKGAGLARELSLMMTEIMGPWTRPVFYMGTWAAVISTLVAVLDGSPRMLVQPIRQHRPSLYAKLSEANWHRLLMTLMGLGSFAVYVLKPDALTLVLWLGAVDAPLVGILFLAYVYLSRRYIPPAYRSGWPWAFAMTAVGIIYLAIGVYYGIMTIADHL
ncbi:MAG: divalent metal cation transporter, partial [Planctomycetes bacterium]|nr:divalent metal cation transporter [Planctomycetota bacterium]